MKKTILLSAIAIALFSSCNKSANKAPDSVPVQAKSVKRGIGPETKKPRYDGDPGDNGCLVVYTNDSIATGNPGIDSLNAMLLYNFRDNFLDGESKDFGVHDRSGYIGYYYNISSYCLKYHIYNGETFLEFYQLLKYAEQVSDKVLNGDQSEIIVTDEVYDFCKAKSLILHATPHFDEISTIVTDLDSDLEILNGKTKAEFVNYFQ